MVPLQASVLCTPQLVTQRAPLMPGNEGGWGLRGARGVVAISYVIFTAWSDSVAFRMSDLQRVMHYPAHSHVCMSGWSIAGPVGSACRRRTVPRPQCLPLSRPPAVPCQDPGRLGHQPRPLTNPPSAAAASDTATNLYNNRTGYN